MSGAEGALPRFPLFISLQGREALVVGGGTVAARRVAVLIRFGAAVTVVSPALCPALEAQRNSFRWVPTAYAGITDDPTLVVAATNDREVNRTVGRDARGRNLPVSVADRKEESTFWFPAIVEGDSLVAGIVSTDGDHGRVRNEAARLREYLKKEEKRQHGKNGAHRHKRKPPGGHPGGDGGGRHPAIRPGDPGGAGDHEDHRR